MADVMREGAARRLELPCFGLVLELDGAAAGTVASQLHDVGEAPESRAAFDAIESLVLAHACAGVDVGAAAYLEGIETAVEAVANHVEADIAAAAPGGQPEATPGTRIAVLESLLRDAAADLRDLDLGYPRRELHRDPLDIVAQARALNVLRDDE